VRKLADGVWQLRGRPPDAINVYLVGDGHSPGHVAFWRGSDGVLPSATCSTR
jgi:glyoxylase-like metal-dependent hydrolase (beta-lactamase superfamily II)